MYGVEGFDTSTPRNKIKKSTKVGESEPNAHKSSCLVFLFCLPCAFINTYGVEGFDTSTPRNKIKKSTKVDFFILVTRGGIEPPLPP